MKKIAAITFVVLALVLVSCKKASVTGDVVAVDKTESLNQETGTCKDSDGGINTDIKGIVTLGKNRYYDTCLTGLLVEYYCENGNQVNQNIRCPNKCDGGKCI